MHLSNINNSNAQYHIVCIKDTFMFRITEMSINNLISAINTKHKEKFRKIMVYALSVLWKGL